MDSGCTGSVVSQELTSAARKPLSHTRDTLVEYGNGSSRVLNHKCPLGRQEGLVDPLSSDSYFAVNDLVGGNNKVIFDKNGGCVTNEKLGVSVPIRLVDNQMYRLSLEDMEAVTQWPYDEALGGSTYINARMYKETIPLVGKR